MRVRLPEGLGLDLGLDLAFETIALRRSAYALPPAAGRAGELPMLLGCRSAQGTIPNYLSIFQH